MSALTDSLKGIGGMKVAVLAMAGIVMLAFFLMLGFRTSVAHMVPLYTDLSLEDSSKIVSKLEATGIPYELAVNGSQVMVPSDRALRLRMDMAMSGLPSGGNIVGYEIFDKAETFGSSNFVMNINMMRALEGELSRTIGALDGVEKARVHLVVPKREVFTKDKDKPSASVTISMRGGKELDRSEVAAITHIIAASVPGLENSRVAVIDSHGRLLARGDGEDMMGGTTDGMMEYRVNYETRTQQNIEDLLEKVIGKGKVQVTVNADINFDRTTINSEKFDPDGQVARSTQSSTEKGDSQEKTGSDSVSAANNLPTAAPGTDNGAGTNQKNEKLGETTNFEISKTIQNQIKGGGNLNKISVAVLVDGTYDPNDDKKYTARSEEDLAKLRALTASAIGYDEKRGDKIEIVNLPFTRDVFKLAEESFFERYKLEFQSIIQTLIIAGVAVLAIVLVIRPAVTQIMRGVSVGNGMVGEALPGADGVARLPSGGATAGFEEASDNELLVDLANVKGGMKSSSVRKVTEIVDKYPEETMGVIRQWITKQG